MVVAALEQFLTTRELAIVSEAGYGQDTVIVQDYSWLAEALGEERPAVRLRRD